MSAEELRQALEELILRKCRAEAEKAEYEAEQARMHTEYYRHYFASLDLPKIKQGGMS